MNEQGGRPGSVGEARSNARRLYPRMRRELQSMHLPNELDRRRRRNLRQMTKVLASQGILDLVLPRMAVDAGNRFGLIAALLQRLSHEVFGNLVDLTEHGGWCGALDRDLLAGKD